MGMKNAVSAFRTAGYGHAAFPSTEGIF